jgi:hypothetical protein
MKFPIGTILQYVTRGVIAAAQAIPAVEAFKGTIAGASGADKKTAVLQLVEAELGAARFATGRDLASDPDVMAAAGAVVDAIVALHNIVGKKAVTPAS